MERLQQLRATCKEQGIDGLVVTNPYNRRYITGFTGSAGIALITQDTAVFITDFRYVEQANKQVQGFEIVEHTGRVVDALQEQVQRLQLNRLGFEEENLTFAIYQLYNETLSTELVPTKALIETIRLVKTDDEISVLKAAAKIADEAYLHILNYIKPGISEIDVANELEFYMRKLGATSSSFDIIVASGWRSALPHGVASDKLIQTGELVTLDYGALFNDYISDITRTVAVGEISEELTDIYSTVLAAQELGVQGIKPGMTGKEADSLTRDYITEKGYGNYFGHSTGHGIGLEVHEGPALSSKTKIKLEKNMVVTVEPGIYIPNVGGCRIEDDIVITADGNERLTHATKELIHL